MGFLVTDSDNSKLLHESGGGALIYAPVTESGGSTKSAKPDKKDRSRKIAEALRRQYEQRKSQEVVKPQKGKPKKKKQDRFEEIIEPIIGDLERVDVGLPVEARKSFTERISFIPDGFTREQYLEHLKKIYELEAVRISRMEAAIDEDEAITLLLLSIN